MEVIFLLILLVTGASLGSFLGVIIERLPTGKDFFHSRSICTSCRRTLAPLDLIPIISFVAFRGKCRICHAKIPLRLLFLEVLSGFILVALSVMFLLTTQNVPLFVFSLIVTFALLVILFIDIDHMIIPDEILVVLGITTLLYLIIFNRGVLIEHIISGLIAFGVFLLLFLVTRGRGIGFGDVKFAAIIGLICGYPGTILAFYIAFVVGAVVALLLIVTKKKKIRGDTIPFGPFLVIGTILAFFFADTIIPFFVQLMS